MLTTVSASALRDDPSARLWALIEHIAAHPAAASDAELQAFSAAYLYDAEVLNGGHLQYFQNHGLAHAPSALLALQAIGAAAQARILREAMSAMRVSPIAAVGSLEDYAELAKADHFSEQDARYYEVKPEVIDLLASFIEPRLSNLVGVASDA